MRSATPLARITYLSCLALLLAGILWGEGAHAADEIPPSVNVYSFGVVPQHTATVLARRWTPFLNYLSEKTGYRINFKTAKDIPTFEERLAAGEYDFAYMNPYHYIVAHRNVGYQVYAKEKGLVRASSGMMTMGLSRSRKSAGSWLTKTSKSR